MVVDDHRVFAEALATRLRHLAPVGAVHVAFSAAEAKGQAAAYPPDLVLLDVHLGHESGTVLAAELIAERPDLPVLMVSGSEEPPTVVDALAHGARAWVPKDVSTEQMLVAIDEVMSGRRWLPAHLVSGVLEQLLSARDAAGTDSTNPVVRAMSARQREVLALLAEGRNRAEIAEVLGVSPNTVRTHIQVMLKKAGVRSTLALLAATRDDAAVRHHTTA
jgi:DNA-binding NarL/FixJ family response regulator